MERVREKADSERAKVRAAGRLDIIGHVSLGHYRTEYYSKDTSSYCTLIKNVLAEEGRNQPLSRSPL